MLIEEHTIDVLCSFPLTLFVTKPFLSAQTGSGCEPGGLRAGLIPRCLHTFWGSTTGGAGSPGEHITDLILFPGVQVRIYLCKGGITNANGMVWGCDVRVCLAFGGAFPCAQTKTIGKGLREQLYLQSEPEEMSVLRHIYTGIMQV